MTPLPQPAVYIGIDVSKDKLDLAIDGQADVATFSNDRRQICALVGLAPFDRDSGHWSGKRSIFGGRGAVRSVLYMATITAIRCNPVISDFARRLQNAGKLPKVVITACMRKLLTILNAMARDGQIWSPSCQLQTT
jgi:transposase